MCSYVVLRLTYDVQCIHRCSCVTVTCMTVTQCHMSQCHTVLLPPALLRMSAAPRDKGVSPLRSMQEQSQFTDTRVDESERRAAPKRGGKVHGRLAAVTSSERAPPSAPPPAPKVFAHMMPQRAQEVEKKKESSRWVQVVT